MLLWTVILVAVGMAVTPASTLTGPLTSGTADDQAAWPTAFHSWSTAEDFASGSATSLEPAEGGGLTLAPGATEGTWTSPWYEPAEPFTRAVPSWQADTPGDSWIQVDLQVRTTEAESRWYVMGLWAFEATAIERHTVDGQSDALGRILTDTFVAEEPVVGLRLRATLHGDDTAIPVLRRLGSTVSRPAALPDVSEPLADEAVELDVPPYSQMIHQGEYEEFGGGGQVWCSPTSTSMVLSYWGTGPTAEDIAALPPDPVFDANGRADGQVDHAALHTWDYTYEGAGNWAFNTAYASAYGLDGSVRQYSTLRDVEAWVRGDPGTPVVVSIAWDNTDDDPTNDLTGASIDSTGGHLMVVIGFTADGDVIANDPASPSNAEVRHVYQRGQFERNWLRASDGTTYIITR